MKLLVFPEALRQQVEAAAVEALGEGHEGLTFTVARLPATNDWAVYATGLDDAVLLRSLCDALKEALRRNRT